MSELWERFQSENQFRFNKDLLQCGMCEKLLSPPVYLSADAGNICKGCKDDNNVDTIRNEALEASLDKALHPCKNAASGCDAALTSDKIQMHQIFCHYSQLKCPNCKKEGFTGLDDILEHCEDAHDMSVLDEPPITIPEYMSNDGVNVALYKFEVNQNLFIVKITQEQWNVLQVIVCCPKGITMNQDLYFMITENNHEVKVRAKIVECWNMLNSTDANHVTSIYLNEMHKTPHGSMKSLSLQFSFNHTVSSHQLKDAENFRKDIECPICLHFLTDTVYKCRNAHTICGACHGLITTCPLCREEMGDTRDTRLENILPQITMNCINKEFGCLFESGLQLLKEHEATCGYQQYTCHFDDCKRDAVQVDLIAHYISAHEAVRNGTQFTLDLESMLHRSIVYANHVFLLESFVECNNYVLKMALINSTARAWQFVYSVHVLDTNSKELFALSNHCGKNLLIDLGLFEQVSERCGSFVIQCFIRKLPFV